MFSLYLCGLLFGSLVSSSLSKHASWWNGNSKLHLGVSEHANANVWMFPYDGLASNPGPIPELNGY